MFKYELRYQFRPTSGLPSLTFDTIGDVLEHIRNNPDLDRFPGIEIERIWVGEKTPIAVTDTKIPVPVMDALRLLYTWAALNNDKQRFDMECYDHVDWLDKVMVFDAKQTG